MSTGFTGNESVNTRERKVKQKEIERLHEKTFKAWMNAQLRQRSLKIQGDLQEELADGLMLINLMEILSGEKCTSKYHAKPTKEIQKSENLAIAIEFIQKFVKVSISSQDFVTGNMKLVLGTIWRLILHFQVDHGEKDGDSAKLSAAQQSRLAKQKLLQWCQDKTKDHKGVNIQDFQASWYDGLGFCALMHAFDPDCIDFDSLSPDNPKENLELAFRLAEEKLDIPRLLDPEDILAEDALSRPDEQCFMTYLSQFPIAFLSQGEKKHDAEAEKRKLEEEESKRRALEEAERAAEARKRAEEEAELARKKAEEAERARLEAEEARKRAEQEREEERIAAQKKLEEAQREAKLAAEKEARKKEKLERQRKAEEDAKRALEDEAMRKQMEKDERDKMEKYEAERRALEEETRRLKEELRRIKGKLIGKLAVTVEQARGLKGGKNDAYCVLFLERQKEKTKTVKKSANPKWDAPFEFYVSEPGAQLEVNVFDWNFIFSDSFLGKIVIPVEDLNDGETTEEWYKLEPKKKKDKVSGELKLSITYHLEK
ncbi:Alpha-actinin-4 [Balamuthia mandrillaris]